MIFVGTDKFSNIKFIECCIKKQKSFFFFG